MLCLWSGGWQWEGTRCHLCPSNTSSLANKANDAPSDAQISSADRCESSAFLRKRLTPNEKKKAQVQHCKFGTNINSVRCYGSIWCIYRQGWKAWIVICCMRSGSTLCFWVAGLHLMEWHAWDGGHFVQYSCYSWSGSLKPWFAGLQVNMTDSPELWTNSHILFTEQCQTLI